MANKKRNYGKLPFYLSTYTDNDGRYTLYIPRGAVYIGAGKEFPPQTGQTKPCHNWEQIQTNQAESRDQNRSEQSRPELVIV